LLRNRDWRRLFTDVPRFLRGRPFPSRGIRRRAQRLLGRDPTAPGFPSWIAPDLTKRLDLEERWSQWNTGSRAAKHPIVPIAHASLERPQWSRVFELADPGLTHSAVEVRYPFLDLRVVNYLLAIPPFPWMFRKHLLRAAMSGHLPEDIRQRPKSPLEGDPLIEILQRPEAAAVDRARWTEQTERFVSPAALPWLNGQKDSVCAGLAIRAHCLNFWLQSSSGVRYNKYAEASNG
jgi:asparagine synthase (glutamine-hydrolysing)